MAPAAAGFLRPAAAAEAHTASPPKNTHITQNGPWKAGSSSTASPIDPRFVPLSERLDLLDDAAVTGLHDHERQRGSSWEADDGLLWDAPPALSRSWGAQ